MNSRLLNTLLFCILAPSLGWAQVDEGLVAHWPFDETRGTIANDVSGNGLDGTVVGATWTQGRIGNALRFDGIDDFLQVPGVGAPPPAQIGALGQGTIAFWVRFEDPDNLLRTIGIPMFYFGTQPGGSEAWDLEIYIGHGKQFVTDDRRIYYTVHRPKVDGTRESPLCFNSAQRLAENTWYHYAVVISRDGNKGYLNGREMTDRIFNFGDPSSTDFFDDVQIQDMLTMGYGWSTPARGFTYFNGWLDDVRIYNRPLSAAEISTLAAGDGDGAGPIYEAEDAAVISPAFVGSRTSGFTGTGYVRYPSSGGSVEFTVDAPSMEVYDLNFRYGLASGQWGAEVRVDGAVIDSMLEFPATGSWSNWQSVATSTTLSRGSHTIDVTSVASVALNLDHLELVENGGPPPPPVGSVTYQMEDGALSGAATIGTHSSGFTGDGYVRYLSAGATVEHAVDVPAAGTYELTFRYGLLSGQVAGQVTVNGQIVDSNLVFPATGSWTNWQTVTTTVDLDAGTPPVALSVSGLTINVDSMVVTPR